jgi:hypothetical protein
MSGAIISTAFMAWTRKTLTDSKILFALPEYTISS